KDLGLRCVVVGLRDEALVEQRLELAELGHWVLRGRGALNGRLGGGRRLRGRLLPRRGRRGLGRALRLALRRPVALRRLRVPLPLVPVSLGLRALTLRLLPVVGLLAVALWRLALRRLARTVGRVAGALRRLAVAARRRAVGGLRHLLVAVLVSRGDRLLQPAHRPAGGVHAHAEEGHAGPATAALPRGLDAAGGGLLHEGVAARSAEGVGLLHVAEQLASVLVVLDRL